MFPGLKTRHKILTVLKIEDTTPFLFRESLLWINKRPHSLWLILKPYSTASKYVHSVCKKDLFYSISENGLQQRVERWTFLSPFLVTGILDNFKIKILQEILFKSLSKETKIRYILISNFLHAYEFLWNISALVHVSLKSTKYSKNMNKLGLLVSLTMNSTTYDWEILCHSFFHLNHSHLEKFNEHVVFSVV